MLLRFLPWASNARGGFWSAVQQKIVVLFVGLICNAMLLLPTFCNLSGLFLTLTEAVITEKTTLKIVIIN